MGEWKDIKNVANAITKAENGEPMELLKTSLIQRTKRSTVNSWRKTGIPVLGITGTGGAGKSSVTDEIVRRFLNTYTDKTIAVISVDPSRKKTGGALLGDRIRMNSISSSACIYAQSLLHAKIIQH